MQSDSVRVVNDWYENEMFGNHNYIFDKIGFFNLGYWKGIESSVELAQINLIETLPAFLCKRDGNLLDVACGKGATTKFATKYFEPGKITGINISEKQLEICRLIAPHCTFQLMDATDLRFPDETFDNVLCVEAAFHFNTRQKFFSEAYRVLAHGGRLAMSDILYGQKALDSQGPSHPKENYVASLAEYEEGLTRAGFDYVRVEDSTEYCARAYKRAFERNEFDRTIDRKSLHEVIRCEELVNDMTCCMVYAVKL